MMTQSELFQFISVRTDNTKTMIRPATGEGEGLVNPHNITVYIKLRTRYRPYKCPSTTVRHTIIPLFSNFVLRGELITVLSCSQNCLYAYSWQVTRYASEKVSGSKASLNVNPVSLTECMARPRLFRAAHIREHFSKRTQSVHCSLLRAAGFVFLLQSFWSSGGSAYYCYFTFSLHSSFSLSPSPCSVAESIASQIEVCMHAKRTEWQIGDTKAKQTTIMICKIEKVGLHF